MILLLAPPAWSETYAEAELVRAEVAVLAYDDEVAYALASDWLEASDGPTGVRAWAFALRARADSTRLEAVHTGAGDAAAALRLCPAPTAGCERAWAWAAYADAGFHGATAEELRAIAGRLDTVVDPITALVTQRVRVTLYGLTCEPAASSIPGDKGAWDIDGRLLLNAGDCASRAGDPTTARARYAAAAAHYAASSPPTSRSALAVADARVAEARTWRCHAPEAGAAWSAAVDAARTLSPSPAAQGALARAQLSKLVCDDAFSVWTDADDVTLDALLQLPPSTSSLAATRTWALRIRGTHLLDAGKDVDGLSLLAAAAELGARLPNPADRAELWTAVGESFLYAHRLTGALHFLDDAVSALERCTSCGSTASLRVEAHDLRGTIYDAQGRYPEALADYDAAVAAADTLPEPARTERLVHERLYRGMTRANAASDGAQDDFIAVRALLATVPADARDWATYIGATRWLALLRHQGDDDAEALRLLDALRTEVPDPVPEDAADAMGAARTLRDTLRAAPSPQPG